MKNEYVCPYCRGNLKIEDDIIFAIRSEKQQRGLLKVSPKLGNYGFTTHPDLELNEGEHVETFCPMCHSNLKAVNLSTNLAEVIMIDEAGVEYQIYFSEIVGEHVTFKIKDSNLESFGDDTVGYINFFGV